MCFGPSKSQESGSVVIESSRHAALDGIYNATWFLALHAGIAYGVSCPRKEMTVFVGHALAHAGRAWDDL